MKYGAVGINRREEEGILVGNTQGHKKFEQLQVLKNARRLFAYTVGIETGKLDFILIFRY